MAASRVADNVSISGDTNVVDSAGITGATGIEAIARPPDYRRMMR